MALDPAHRLIKLTRRLRDWNKADKNRKRLVSHCFRYAHASDTSTVRKRRVLEEVLDVVVDEEEC